MNRLNISSQKLTFFASAQLFLSLSILFGTWVIYIPQIIEKLKMSEGQLGIVLLFGAIGSLIATPFGKSIVSKYGEGRMSFFSVAGLSIFIIAIFTAPSFYYLCAAFLMFGFCGGFYQIAVNSMVATIERQNKVSIMSSCHGFFSLGALISSGLGTILLIAIGNALIHVLLASGLVLVLQILFVKTYFNIKNTVVVSTKSEKGQVKKYGMLIWIALIGIAAMVTEGAIADWSGLFLKDVALVKVEYLGLGYAGFSLSMTMGRFMGDFFSKKFGALQIVLAGFILSIFGFVLVLTGHTYISIVGFFIIGAGFSIIVPEVYRMSANLEGVDSSSGIAFISGASYVGFLVGPPLLGIIAETYGLSISFIALLGLVGLGTVLAIALKVSSSFQLIKSS
ncbi:MAG: MFS transporter [Salinivirgaceae bacterium]|jgi:predicted MFS family arabinose efflux permease|nr:MFS transporter [Salinivirgaceae bacterium]